MPELELAITWDSLPHKLQTAGCSRLERLFADKGTPVPWQWGQGVIGSRAFQTEPGLASNRQRIHINRPADQPFAFGLAAGGVEHALPGGQELLQGGA